MRRRTRLDIPELVQRRLKLVVIDVSRVVLVKVLEDTLPVFDVFPETSKL